MRIEDELGWPHQRTAYVGVFDRLVGRDGRNGRKPVPSASDSPPPQVIQLPADEPQSSPARNQGL
jgi:hypothetical protein